MTMMALLKRITAMARFQGLSLEFLYRHQLGADQSHLLAESRAIS